MIGPRFGKLNEGYILQVISLHLREGNPLNDVSKNMKSLLKCLIKIFENGLHSFCIPSRSVRVILHSIVSYVYSRQTACIF